MSDPTNKTKESCENAKLLVVVFDRPTAFDVRQAIRHAWANSANVPNGVVVKFILGLTENTSIDAQLFNESIIHDDLILSTLKDGYDVIYHKVAAGFHWHQAFCPTKYWMKLDDDMTIDLVRFLYWINHEFDQRHQEHPASVFGELWTDPNIRKVHRSGKWNVTKEQWENDLWPDYMPGACYVMSNEAVKRTIDTMPKAHTMHVEDALYTGIIADIANISKIDATKIIDATETKLPDTVKCYDGVPLFSVYNSMPNNLSVPEEHTRLYNDLVNLKQKCGTKDDTGIPCYSKCNRTDLIDISGPSQTTANRTDIDGASQILASSQTPTSRTAKPLTITTQSANQLLTLLTTAPPILTTQNLPHQATNLSLLPSQQKFERHIKVGIILPDNTSIGTDYEQQRFEVNAGAITIGLQRIMQEQLLPNTNFTFVWYFGNCEEYLTAGYVTKLIKQEKVDVIIGPICTEAVKVAGVLGKFYNLPFLIWGSLMGTDLKDKTRFPTLTLNALFYLPRKTKAQIRCAAIQEDFDNIPLITTTNMTLVYKRNTVNDSFNEMKAALQLVKNRARIIVGCFETNIDRRTFMLAAAEAGLTSDEYVFIYLESRKKGFGIPPFWLEGNDGKDEIVKKQSEKLMIIDGELTSNSTFTDFQAQVMQKMHEWPFYCDYCSLDVKNVTSNAISLADAFYVYGLSLNRSIAEYGEAAVRNGTLLSYNSRGEFMGFGGRVMINDLGVRRPVYNLIGLNALHEETIFAVLSTEEKNGSQAFTPLYTEESMSIWAIRGGRRGRRQEMARLNALWQVHHSLLEKRKGDKGSSLRSFGSIRSSHTSMSTPSHRSLKYDTDNVIFCVIHGTPVIARKHSPKFLPSQITEQDRAQLRYMRQLDHSSLNKFLGLCHNSVQYLSLWAYCERGTLSEVIEQYATNLDGFILTAMIRDICQGISAIHNSPVLGNCHGSLTSNCIVVNDRWQVRVQYYGLSCLKAASIPDDNSRMHILKTILCGNLLLEFGNLWTAPEILRDRSLAGKTQKGDIYSFAIICSEIITRKSAWNLEETGEGEDQIVYRPHLIRDCWNEDPDSRPDINTIRNALKAMLATKGTNLMDYIFTLLEKNASELSLIVDERTGELIQEKKKADILLYRLLPRLESVTVYSLSGLNFRLVADRMKLGQTVAPELYESVTVFFSDVVVNLLNDLYTTFDSIIEQHNVYKVETIGDGLHCVSGLPIRNGNEHVQEICGMAFGFLRCLKTFKVAHLPDYRINIRVGIHTGPCVAGVVGLTAPRYCVFGDTVNLAARMESSSKPGRIHISAETNRYLAENYKNVGFKTESRGEVLIKGAGAAETFWLIPPEESSLYVGNEEKDFQEI
ncbi:adenylate and guanylate cyclase catalytic domain-containing protein [Ditylenchus destructor]|nr:adenylate and guanylate cyclase catalytic domain-containing protein [Ditylenchus destructor]